MATAPAYTAHQWEDGEVITAERLNAIENQLAALSAAGGIGTSNIADGAVTSAKIGASAVGAGNIADGAVTSAKIGASAVGAGKIGVNAVATANIQDKAVTAAKIADGVIPEKE